MDHKSFPSFVMKVDDAQGIVEHLIAVMGNKDLGNDVIHPGAFTKTLNERGRKVRVLDLHKTDSIMRVLGKPVTLREIGVAELPQQVKERFPTANGGLLVVTQFNLKTVEGLGAFERIKAGDIDEWSFGYDAVNPDYSKMDGVTVRNLREVKLYEYSPVIFGMNPAPTTLGAKAAKPWNVFFEDGKYRVYKIDADGAKVGDLLGEHDTDAEAQAQLAALYANEGKGASGAAGLLLAARDRAWDATAADGRVRTWAGATDAPNAKYRQAFFWYDNTAPDNFTSYKLQFADVVGGELQAIPRGIFAVANVLSGARGGADITDVDAVKSKVAAYYAKMRSEFEDEGIAPPWEKSGKAITFLAALAQESQERTLNEQRWQLESALSDSMYSIVRDPALDTAAKTEAYRQSLAQFIEATVTWFGQALAANYWSDVNQGAIPKSSKAGRRMKGDMVDILKQMEALMAQLRQWANYQDGDGGTPPPAAGAPASGQAAVPAKSAQAGPSDATPTSMEALRQMVEIELNLLEV